MFNGPISFYNGLQTSAKKRFSQGCSVWASYTFSKALDYRSTNNEASTGGVWNPSNWRMQHGPPDCDRRHLFVSSLCMEPAQAWEGAPRLAAGPYHGRLAAQRHPQQVYRRAAELHAHR